MAEVRYRAKKGLEGIVFDETAISKVIPEEKKLLYRGYAVDELAERCAFEEVAYLLLHGALPNRAELEAFQERERSARAVDPAFVEMMGMLPPDRHPMDALRTIVSGLGTTEEFRGDEDRDGLLRKSERLLAKLPTIVALEQRLREGQSPIEPDPSLSIAENFFHMGFDRVPRAELTRAFDASLTLYAEHGFNASTFTARVVVSSLSDLVSGVTAAIGSLKGPLHGGANEAVMRMLIEIEQPERARDWVLDALARKRKIMGFGHRVYRLGDSRVPTMTRYRDEVAQAVGDAKWTAIANEVERTVHAEKGIPPNLDYPAAPAYYLMGIPIDLFTPIFVMARVTGWCAHMIEQLGSNRIVRPLGDYSGPPERPVPALQER